MAAVREQLFASTFWGIRRPKAALTTGHFVIRLNDPALAFGSDSAGDLLQCYRRLIAATEYLHGPVRGHIYVSLNWQPVGDAIGEPVAETSTPTVHVFLEGDELPAPSSILRPPAHDRLVEAVTPGADSALRQALHSLDVPETPPPALPSGAFRIVQLGGSHWTTAPEPPSVMLRNLGVERILELAATLESLLTRADPPFSGATLWACEQWDGGGPVGMGDGGEATINIFGRRHGGSRNPVAEFVLAGALDLPAAGPNAHRPPPARSTSPPLAKDPCAARLEG
ncbi:hypothetical protein [Arthrobacter sp. HLT1-20]